MRHGDYYWEETGRFEARNDRGESITVIIETEYKKTARYGPRPPDAAGSIRMWTPEGEEVLYVSKGVFNFHGEQYTSDDPNAP